jgi:vacuolar iron transporter family protein
MSMRFSSLSFLPFLGATSSKEEAAAGDTMGISSAKSAACTAGEGVNTLPRHTSKIKAVAFEAQPRPRTKIKAVDAVVDDFSSTDPVYDLNENEDMEKQKKYQEVNKITSASTTKKLTRLLDEYIDVETKYHQERRKHLATSEKMKRLHALMQQELERDCVEVQLYTDPSGREPETFQESFQKSFQNSSPNAKMKSGQESIFRVEETTANESATSDGDNSRSSNSDIRLKRRVSSYDSHDISLFLDDKRVDDPKSPATTEHLGDSRQYWRDIILGVNDGLVSTFLLVAGVAGGGMATLDILLTAIAGAVAGAVSMCAGEYIATKSQNEIIRGEVKLEQKHIQKYPEDELLEVPPLLELIGISKIDRDLQKRLIKHYAKNHEALLQLMVVLELGFLEDEQRSPFKAGFVSFFLFLFGAIPSIVPFMIPDIEPMAGLIASAVATSCTLLMVGMVKTWASKGNCLTAALENLTVAGIGGAIAYGAGLLAERVFSQ